MDSNRMVISDHPSDPGCTVIKGMRIRRCNGCADCIKGDLPRCSIEDDISPVLDAILDHRVLEIRTDVSDGWFAMPMRKVVERLANILQAFTDAGGNVPRDRDTVALREVVVVVRSDAPVESLETDSGKLLRIGPVDSLVFEYV